MPVEELAEFTEMTVAGRPVEKKNIRGFLFQILFTHRPESWEALCIVRCFKPSIGVCSRSMQLTVNQNTGTSSSLT